MVPNSGVATATSSILCGWAEPNSFDVRGYDRGGVVNKGPCGVNCSNNYSFYSFHPGGVNVCMADGSVRFLSNTTSATTVAALITKAGGEVIAENP